MEPKAITIFCDDIRVEQSQKIILIGVYGPVMLISGTLPVMLPNLCFYVQVRLPHDGPLPTKVNIYLPGAQDDSPNLSVDIAAPLAEEIEKAKNAEPSNNAIIATNVPIFLGPTVIGEEGLIKVRVLCGESVIKAGSLKVTLVDQAPNV
jgi:hypothetical protein